VADVHAAVLHVPVPSNAVSDKSATAKSIPDTVTLMLADDPMLGGAAAETAGADKSKV